MIANAIIDGRTGRVLQANAGIEIAWPMARGIPGAYGGIASAWWIFVPLCLLVAASFYTLRVAG
jgi:hypothetical protein